MNDIMLDIETFATKHNAVVIQIALQRFDRNTGELGEHLVLYPKPAPQKERGLLQEDTTVMWWKRQDPKIMQNIKANAEDVEGALKKMRKFITFSKDIVWCHSSFDGPILQNLFAAFGLPPAWNYTRMRDLRTLVDLAGLDMKSYNWDGEKSHDALEDCRFQIKYTMDAIRKLKIS